MTERTRDTPDATENEERTNGYVPLRSYGAIGDGRTVALIALDGRIDWLPIPSMDSPPVFASIVDAEHGGHVALRPVDDQAQVSRAYLPGTNVLVTTWTTPTGTATVTDAMVTGVAGRLPWAEIGRCVQGVEGTVEMEWAVVPGTILNTAEPRRLDTANGTVIGIDGVTIAIVEQGFEPVHDEGPRFSGRFATAEGSKSILTIVGTYDEPIFLPEPERTLEGVDRTIENWSTWSKEFSYDGPWSDAVQRSALALKLLIFAPTGAIAAAPTTSLPEDRTGGKNWDYRFAWVRDLAYTVHALTRFGLREETHAAVSWVMRTIAEHDETMPIFYGLDGSKSDDVEERDVPGWNGIGPVTIGNRAGDQLQLGVWGDVFEIMRQYVRAGNVLDRKTASVLQDLADDACHRWVEPDSGMWELQEAQHYTTSKIGCWQALDAAVELHDAGMIDGPRDKWVENRELIEDWVAENGWDEELGHYVMYPGTDALDCSILLHAMSAFDRGPRMESTIRAIEDQLQHGPLVYRYSGIQDEESPFVACSFWLAAALACVGRSDDAKQLMDDMVAQANDVGLFSEMLSAVDGDFMGNIPQGLSHLALIQAALTIEELSAES
ncbi:glycoside hydrolase family 15 protein [Curtobacterium aurantiacum]|uniref:Glycoside hydrolase family 15 protein n=1 Tax=Curtobacterium aurantiacum TaxID=3236919 RepID=A0ABS5VHS9_9MICO|nr:glycoside hydrolase family 15 protein [Curtobacterium flaccumfaciens]MBT1546971.1 glycoside hydrolase family 15 protein [Curtobacterium flaccumfaciens pv. flaccumfaciens]MBT1588338.1 glycoside hydrolase family 15 protein [Curtobacterium flaccumfaciens pv. flaccumfaciens]